MRSHHTTTREKPPPQSLQLEKSQRGSEALFDTTQPNNKIIKKRKRNGSWGGGQGWPWRHATFCGLPRAGSVTWVVHGKSLLMPSFSSILQHNVRTHFSPWWYIYLAIRWLWGIHKWKIKHEKMLFPYFCKCFKFLSILNFSFSFDWVSIVLSTHF